MDNLPELITNYGFPIVLTFYLLIRTENKMENLTVAINDLNKIISNCTK